MPRMTKAQIGMLLADYDARSRELRKLDKAVSELKEQIRGLDLKEGAYGDFTYAAGTPREILDQPAARKLITDHGLKVPTVMTSAPIVVKPKASTK